MARVERLLDHPVGACDRGNPAQRRQRVAQAGSGEIGAGRLRFGRQWLEAVRRAPGAEIVEIGLVRPQRLRRVGGRLVGSTSYLPVAETRMASLSLPELFATLGSHPVLPRAARRLRTPFKTRYAESAGVGF
jgi:hypothetical protein